MPLYTLSSATAVSRRLALAAVTLTTPLCLAQNPTALVTIQLDKPLHAVSPTLYGLMTEEINYSYDGGVYAEMVRNRTFQDHDFSGIAHWDIEHIGSSIATMKLDPKDGPSEALPHSLLIDIKQADSANPAGVRNEGYWGMAVRPETRYRGSLYAKTDSANLGPLSISLVDEVTGKTLASTSVDGVSSKWARHEFTLTTGHVEATSKAHLLLTAGHAGKLWIDVVSLFPPTYKNRPNGNRPDLMEKMAEMHPRFLRMPGGNYLEGGEVADRFPWKKTLGPLADRPTHPGTWSYRSSDGMGLLEFLEWTEDLKIDPVLAVYAGYSLRGTHIEPGTALQPFVDEALQEIEFTMGDASTPWGAVRAKLGHPAPFPVQYVEIGNEDFFDKSGSYEGRFAQFYKAIKAKYPKLQLIATMPVKGMKPDVVDDHYYRRADDFFEDVKHYDKTDRNGPRIFVGEWATREGSPTTNMGAALGDAAWMTGLERNSDLVVMASYAPLFVNVNPGGMQWQSDLIGYDAMSSYGAPSFYVQSMFAQYLGSEVPASSSSGGSSRFFYSATKDAGQGKLFLKLVNASSNPQAVEVRLDGVATVAKGATLLSLAAAGLASTNTLTDPTRIVPVKYTVDVDKSFSHTMPGYSIEVMELSTK